MRKLIKAARKLDNNDVCIIAGALGVGFGIWLIYHPAAYITIGAALFWWGYAGSRSKK